MKLQLTEEYWPVYSIGYDETTAVYAEIDDDIVGEIEFVFEEFDRIQNILRNAYYGVRGE